MPRTPGRRYNEEEVRAVLGRAIERQEAARHPEPYDDGLTLDELRRIAAEVGVDPRYVEAAAAELERPPEVAANPYFGGPTKAVIERTVEGELAEADVAPLIEVIDATLKPKRRGRIYTLAGTVEWIAQDRNIGNEVRFRAEPENGRTRLTLHHSFHSSAALMHVWQPMLAVFGLIPLLAPDGSLTAALLFLVAAVVLYGIARFGYARHTRQRIREVEDAMDRIEAMAARTTPPAALDAATAQQIDAGQITDTEQLIDTDDLLDAEDHPAAARRTTDRQKTR